MQRMKTSALSGPSHLSSGDFETWRRCQCNAVNCLLVLLCHSKLTGKALKHFIFRDQFESVLELVIDPSSAPHFLSWTEAKNTKKGKKIVNTGIKLSTPPQLPVGSSGSLVVSLESISQDCKVFDFVGLTDITTLEDLTSVIEMEVIDGDSLDIHECIAFLTSAIKKTVECGITCLTVGQPMPEWMSSLNGLLRNPSVSRHSKSFIVKIVFKCIEVFEPYAAFWYHPLLYALSVDACGDGLACFFNQVLRKLIEWQPQALRSEMETKLWSNILGKVIACFTLVCPENERHLLNTITLIVQTKNDVVPPYPIIIRFLTSKVGIVSKVMLKTCCILFENNIRPFLLNECEMFYNILKRKLDDDFESEITACLIGFIVKTTTESDQGGTCVDSVTNDLSTWNREDKGKFLQRLKGISQSCPHIAKTFIQAALSILEKPKMRSLQSNVITIFVNYAGHVATPELFCTLKENRFFELVTSGSLASTKRSVLKVLKYFSFSEDPGIREFILNFLKLNTAEFSSYSLRLQAYEIILELLLPTKDSAVRFPSGNSGRVSTHFRQWLCEQLLSEKSYTIQQKLIRFLGTSCVGQCSSEDLALHFLDGLLSQDYNSDAMTIMVTCFLERSRGAISQHDVLFSHPIAETCDKSLLLPVEPDDGIQPWSAKTIAEGHRESRTEPSLEPSIQSSYEKKDAAGINKVPPENEDIATSVENVFLRTYNYGPFPNVQVPIDELILLLLSHCKSNPITAGKLFTDILSCVLNCKTNVSLQKRFNVLLPKLLYKFCQRKIDPRAVSFILELCWVNGVAVDSILLHNVCQMFRLLELGVLMAENQIWSHTTIEHSLFHRVASISNSPYNYNLAIFLEDLKFPQIAKSILNMSPSELHTHLADDPNVSMGTVYSHYVKLKELSLLGDWKLLDEEIKRVNRFPSSSQYQNDYSHLHLDFQVLAEINLKLKGGETSSSEMISRVMKSEITAGRSEETHWGNRSFLLLVNGQVDNFKCQSENDVFSLTQMLALDERFTRSNHRSLVGMILDNYLMSVALDEKEKAQFHGYLEVNQDCVDNPVGWHQRLIHKERFVEMYLGEELPRFKPSINRSRKEYVRQLISNEKIEAAKACISQYYEGSVNTSLETCMISLSESKQQTDKKLKSDLLWDSWTALGALSGMSLHVQTLSVLSDICHEFLLNLRHNEKLDQKRLRESLCSESPTTGLEEAIVQFGLQSHLKAILSTDALDKALCYVKTAEFSLSHHKESSREIGFQLDETSVRCILKSMALGCKIGIDLFPKALNLIIINPSLSSLFDKESSKIEPSSFKLWLPQLMGSQNLDNPVVLEPLLMRLVDSFPQDFFLLLHPIKDDLFTTRTSVNLKIWKKVGSECSGQNLIDSLGSVCHPNLLLKTLTSRLLQASSSEQATSIYQEIKEKCFFLPHRGMLIGKLYLMNEKYVDLIDKLYDEIAQGGIPYPSKKAAEIVGQIEIEPLDRYLMLESFSPYLSSFDSRTFKFRFPYTNSGPLSSAFLVGFSSKVATMNSLRKPMRVEMLGSDGLSHSIILKFGDDLRRDQCLQQLFTVMNASVKRAGHWNGETLVTYTVLPLTKDFGMIEMVNSTVSMIALINNNFTDSAVWRSALLAQHENWVAQASRESAQESKVTKYAQAAAFYLDSEIVRSMASLSSSTPKNILGTCLLNHSSSPRTYFHNRLGFLRSHALMSAFHWILGVGDRHLGNILLSLSTCEVIGIDFSCSFGAAIERSPVPEFVPFRLTPQFSKFYSLYTTGILKQTIVKCLTSIDAESLSVVTLLFDHFTQCGSRKDSTRKASDQHRIFGTSWEVDMIARKLSLEHPVAILKDHLRAGNHNDKTISTYECLLDRISQPSTITFYDQIADSLINLASNPVVLGVAYSGFESWI